MEDELFLSVGLTSNLKASQFPRKPLNLVITLEYEEIDPSHFRKCRHHVLLTQTCVQHIRLDGLYLRYRLRWQAQDRDRQGGNPHAP